MADEVGLGGLGGIEKSLTTKIGGLPGFAWVGIAIGAVILYKKYKGKSSAPATSTSVTDSTAPADMVTSGASSTPLGTNATWAQTAANQLMATSSYSPSDIQTALANYQSGYGLSSIQQTIIDSALHTFGTPPEGVIPTYSANIDSTLINGVGPAYPNDPNVATPPPTAGGQATPPSTPLQSLPTVGAQPFTPPAGQMFYAPPSGHLDYNVPSAPAGQQNTSLAGSSAKGN